MALESETPIYKIPVLIVGAGPSGATTALHLARHGIKCLVISRHRGAANTPRAHIFNQRAMEVLRDAGIEQRCIEKASSMTDMAHSSFLHTLSGEEYARLWSWGNKPAEKGKYETASPCSMCDLPQSILEPILIDEARKLGVEFRFYTEFGTLVQHPDHVSTIIRSREDGVETNVISDYIVGCDGARSAVVEALGIPIDGHHLNDAFNVHIEADLGRFVAHRPGSLNWILNPDAPDWSAVGNFRMVRPWTEWIVSMHPASVDNKASVPSETDILSRLHQMIGDDTVPIKILSIIQWTINNRVARYWHKERALCIGDTTHRHPPINGLGSNTCISDAFNVAWKIAYVLKGLAHPSLLETLTSERKPVGDRVVRRANEGMAIHRKFWSLIGLTPETRKAALARLRDPGIPGQIARREWRDCLGSLELEVQALGIQMNQVYTRSSAIHVEAGDPEPQFNGLDQLKDQFVCTYPGYHLPHAWVAANGQSKAISTLDLAGHGRFTLLTGPGGDVWKQAAKIFNGTPLEPHIVCYSIGPGCDYMDCYLDWAQYRGVEDNGVVLVRPDHFVAWRCSEPPDNVEDTLQRVISNVLHWKQCETNGDVTNCKTSLKSQS